jgi:CHAT domain-containing protein
MKVQKPMSLNGILITLLLSGVSLLYGQHGDSHIFDHQVDSLVMAARVCMDNRQFDQALETLNGAENIAQSAFGSESEPYAKVCLYRGVAFYRTKRYTEAESWIRKSMKITESVNGLDSKAYALGLYWLANWYLDGGRDPANAESNFKQSIAILKAKNEVHTIEYVNNLFRLGDVFWFQGKYEKILALSLEAKSILEADPKISPQRYPSCLNRLAILYHQLGYEDEVESLYLGAISAWAKMSDTQQYAIGLNNLANFYRDSDRFQDAEPLYYEALAIFETTRKNKPGDYSESLMDLAELYLKTGHYDKVDSVLYLSMANLENLQAGIGQHIYALCLNKLAESNLLRGQYKEGLTYARDAKSTIEKVSGKQHPDYVASLNVLAHIYRRLQLTENAEATYKELCTLNRAMVSGAVPYFSEKELNHYLTTFSSQRNNLFSIANDTISQISPELCFDNALFFKGFLLSAANQLRQKVQADSANSKKWELLNSYHGLLANEYSKTLDRQNDVKYLEAKVNELERELAGSIAGYQDATSQVRWQDIQKELLPGEVAIEFIHYPTTILPGADTIEYAALLVNPAWKKPRMVRLFHESDLNSLLGSEQDEKRQAYVERLYSVASRGIRPTNAPRKTLYDLIWAPLLPVLDGVHTIHFAPSGKLHRISLSAIKSGEEETIADRFKLTQLNSTRQLIGHKHEKTDPRNGHAVVMGNINFEADSSAALRQKVPPIEPLSGSVVATSRGKTQIQSEWGPLLATRKEVTGITTLLTQNGWNVDAYTQLEATEEKFKQLDVQGTSPKLLHLATHGFFYPENPRLIDTSLHRNPFVNSTNPMIRSGLVLAGGNFAWKNGQPLVPGSEDGILTAFEISRMNLSNTDLVILSACETGLGDIEGHEGVYGLQRAYKIAGVKYLIMSLWQVGDIATAAFMTKFYRYWLEEKMSIPEAFRATQLAMRDRDLYDWAGFVLVE